MNKKLIQEIKRISKQYNLTIREFKDKVDWCNVSINQRLSESFIREFKDKVNWTCISIYQRLSESFIREFKDKFDWDWGYISVSQKLSESFIREFKDKVSWVRISIYQKLSESFIREFKDKVYWPNISIDQKLSESFIREFKDKVDWEYISYYQKLSSKFRKEFSIVASKNNWIYKPVNFKLAYIKKNTNYEVIDNKYIIAYKSVRDDYCSVFARNHYKYEIGKEYESHCDCNINNDNSFGLSAWTKEGALQYHNKGKLLKVQIAIKDIGAIVQNNKIRCFKFKVLEEIK